MTKPEKRGRPSLYTQEIADEICRRIASGESLRSVCSSDNMPDEKTVRDWVLQDREGFSPQYARACDIRAENWADEIVQIADNAEDPQKARLQVDARKWVVSKILPKFSDKQQVELSGEVKHGVVVLPQLVEGVVLPQLTEPDAD